MTKFKSQRQMLLELNEWGDGKYKVAGGWLLIDGVKITNENITIRLRGLMTERGLNYLKD